MLQRSTSRLVFVMQLALASAALFPFSQTSVAAESAPARARVSIAAGSFAPLYGLPKDRRALQIRAFQIDQYPVTNQDFQRFAAANPNWRRGQALALLVDENYLKHWEIDGDTVRPSHVDLLRPLVNVSWFAANEFCAAAGGRLPKLNEWEYVAAADEKQRNALRDPSFVERLLAWYARPVGSLPQVGAGAPNVWGVHDLHGLVWEWTEDFNSVFVTGDNRQDGDDLKNLFCGAGALRASDKSNYAAFMRYALRNSVQASYTLENLGFRCAYD